MALFQQLKLNFSSSTEMENISFSLWQLEAIRAAGRLTEFRTNEAKS